MFFGYLFLILFSVFSVVPLMTCNKVVLLLLLIQISISKIKVFHSISYFRDALNVLLNLRFIYSTSFKEKL